MKTLNQEPTTAGLQRNVNNRLSGKILWVGSSWTNYSIHYYNKVTYHNQSQILSMISLLKAQQWKSLLQILAYPTLKYINYWQNNTQKTIKYILNWRLWIKNQLLRVYKEMSIIAWVARFSESVVLELTTASTITTKWHTTINLRFCQWFPYWRLSNGNLFCRFWLIRHWNILLFPTLEMWGILFFGLSVRYE